MRASVLSRQPCPDKNHALARITWRGILPISRGMLTIIHIWKQGSCTHAQGRLSEDAEKLFKLAEGVRPGQYQQLQLCPFTQKDVSFSQPYVEILSIIKARSHGNCEVAAQPSPSSIPNRPMPSHLQTKRSWFHSEAKKLGQSTIHLTYNIFIIPSDKPVYLIIWHHLGPKTIELLEVYCVMNILWLHRYIKTRLGIPAASPGHFHENCCSPTMGIFTVLIYFKTSINVYK